MAKVKKNRIPGVDGMLSQFNETKAAQTTEHRVGMCHRAERGGAPRAKKT